MAKRVLKIPDDLTFQRIYDRERSGLRCVEYQCERYPDLRIRSQGPPANWWDWTAYYVVDSANNVEGFSSLRRAYTFLMSRPRRVVRDKNIPRRDADGHRVGRKAEKYVPQASGRGRPCR